MALLLVLASCTEAGAPHDATLPAGSRLGADARAECLAAGGTIGRGGLLPDEICFRPMRDGGKACTRAADCEGICLADDAGRGQCSKVSPVFGCFEFLDEQGRKVGLCVD